jgi:hypothetical protein
VKHLLVEDDNTKYFQLVAIGKHQKQRIYSLEDDNGVRIEEELKIHISKYYKRSFWETRTKHNRNGCIVYSQYPPGFYC